ncbi:MAG: hypothetical protein OK449_01190 [Thaumarchaeota archaeon]|nr:hypothetical protein [Nitrososphaerota archaeon]
MLGSFLLAVPPTASATGVLVQQASGGCFFGSCMSEAQTASFSSHVTGGDIVVVAIASWQIITSAPAVSDTLGLSFTQAAYVCNPSADEQCSDVLYATVAAGGADTVTVTYPVIIPNVSDIFVYELAGVTTAGATSSSGFGRGSPVSTSTASFTSLGFAVGVVNILGGTSYTPGAGFTASTASSGSMQGYAEYATSGISSPTSFPATIGNNNYWAAVGLALNLAPAAPVSTPSCPSTFGGTYMPDGATFADLFGNTWVAPSGNVNGGAYSSYFFPGAPSSIPPPMYLGWAGSYGTYNGQQGWIISFYCNG